MRLALLLAVLAAASGRPARAAEVVVVTPDSPMPPYQEALRGVCDALGACPPVLTASASRNLPSGARVVIALGGRAARRAYPASAALVTALTPGYAARGAAADGKVVRVQMDYSPAEFVRRLRLLKPAARRVLLLWAQASSRDYAEAVRAAAAPSGLEVLTLQVSDSEEIPGLLRGLPASDAIWLAPDPRLVTPLTFDAVLEYARERKIAFFAPAPGLAARGADAGLAPGFRDAGLTAGAAARRLLEGGSAPVTDYPDAPPASADSLMVSTNTSSSVRSSR
jgi:ABC-type uncharacterized transport system substrate-binding protein